MENAKGKLFIKTSNSIFKVPVTTSSINTFLRSRAMARRVHNNPIHNNYFGTISINPNIPILPIQLILAYIPFYKHFLV